MLCSADELLLGDDHSGILILDRGTPGDPLDVGDSEPGDHGDRGHLQPARLHGSPRRRARARRGPRPADEASTSCRPSPARPTHRVATWSSVSIDEPDLCSRYIGGVIKGVKVGPSPDWLQRRLRACGVRPINNVVDITNYVLLEYAQPLHAFDLAKLHGAGDPGAPRARRARSCCCLDGVERDLTPEMLVIADAERPVAIAGVIGGEETAVTDGDDRHASRGGDLQRAERAPDRARPRAAHRGVRAVREGPAAGARPGRARGAPRR